MILRLVVWPMELLTEYLCGDVSHQVVVICYNSHKTLTQSLSCFRPCFSTQCCSEHPEQKEVPKRRKNTNKLNHISKRRLFQMVTGFPKHINSEIRKNKTENKRWSEVRWRKGSSRIFEPVLRGEHSLTSLKSPSFFILKTICEGNKSYPHFTEA